MDTRQPAANPASHPLTHPTGLSDEALLLQCRFERSRSSGPGGQHRNKVETHVTLTHLPTGAAAQAGERRSQGDNKRVALTRLRLVLALEVRTGPATTVSPLWRGRLKGSRIQCNEAHRDFATLLAEALDAIKAGDYEPRAAAEFLACSASQLIKLVKKHPPAFDRWNTERAAAGLHPLK
ncbi:MAG: hypothetical protein ACI9WU_000618 [Myxococcota bacterium]|jgi:hypothetical protein